MRRLIAVWLLLAPWPLAAQTGPSAQELAGRIQAHYAAVRDFTADFTLTNSSELLKRKSEDRGTVAVKKPGRMRWKLDTGSRDETVSDGSQIYTYLPKDRMVQYAPIPTDADAPADLLFLTGRGDLVRDFTAALPATPPASGEWSVVLTPKNRQADFRQLVLSVDRASWQLRGFVVTDTHGGVRTFRFTNLKENVGLPDSRFNFEPPKGVEIRR